MTLKTFDFEGQTAGTTLTTGNSGAQSLTPNTGTIKFSTRTVASGVMGVEHTTGSLAAAVARYYANAQASLSLSIGALIRVEQAPTSGYETFLGARNSGATQVRLEWSSTNTMGIAVTTASPVVILSGTYTPGTAYWVTMRVTAATSTTGQVTVNVYDATGVTLIGSGSSSTFDAGTTAWFGVDIGIINPNAATGSKVSYDYLALNDGSTTELFPPVTAYTGSVALSGSGALTFTAVSSFLGSIGFTGSSTPTFVGFPGFNGAWDTSGSGQGYPGSGFPGTGTPGFTQTDAFTGFGQFAALGSPGLAGSTALDGTSNLDTITSNPTFTTGVNLSGSGTLTMSAPVLGSVSLSGAGALTLAGLLGAIGQLHPVGTDDLTLTGTFGVKSAVGLAGAGTLSFGSASAASGHVALGGAGALALMPVFGSTGSIQFTVGGVLDAEGTVGATATLQLTAEGQLTLVRFNVGRNITVRARIGDVRYTGHMANDVQFTGHVKTPRWTGKIID